LDVKAADVRERYCEGRRSGPRNTCWLTVALSERWERYSLVAATGAATSTRCRLAWPGLFPGCVRTPRAGRRLRCRVSGRAGVGQVSAKIGRYLVDSDGSVGDQVIPSRRFNVSSCLMIQGLSGSGRSTQSGKFGAVVGS